MTNLKDYIEELTAIRRTCLLTFRNEVGSVIQIRTKITDFYIEEGEHYIITDAGIRIALNAILEIDNILKDSVA